MTIFAHSFGTSLRGLLIPLVGTLLLCYVGLQFAPHQAGTGVDRSAGQWLHLPGLLLVAAALGATLDGWPLFSRARPGYGWILRVENRPLHGCLAAALGTLAALTAILVVAGLGFYTMLVALHIDQGEVRIRLPVTLQSDRPYLDHRHATLTFRVSGAGPARGVRLRPTPIVAGTDVSQARLRILADGEPLHAGWIDNAGEMIELVFLTPRPIRNLVIEREPGAGLVLRLRADQVEVVSAASGSGMVNCVLALLSYLGAAVLALSVMILGHAHLALPVNFAAGLVVYLLATLLELTPSAAAITAFARGRWLLGALPGNPLAQALWTTALGIGFVGLAWLLHRFRQGYAPHRSRLDVDVPTPR